MLGQGQFMRTANKKTYASAAHCVKILVFQILGVSSLHRSRVHQENLHIAAYKRWDVAFKKLFRCVEFRCDFLSDVLCEISNPSKNQAKSTR